MNTLGLNEDMLSEAITSTAEKGQPIQDYLSNNSSLMDLLLHHRPFPYDLSAFFDSNTNEHQSHLETNSSILRQIEKILYDEDVDLKCALVIRMYPEEEFDIELEVI